MKIATTTAELKAITGAWRKQHQCIGFVPTMGNLHQGHLSLVKLAKQHTDYVVVSIFVNPLQFGPQEDFQQYPRTFDRDKELLSSVEADLLYLPNDKEIYPQGMQQHTQITVPGISSRLCGISRPGHFTGVATIVNKLLNIVTPDIAFFGQKDFQQVAIIRQMVQDLNLPVAIMDQPTVREVDGLAMSSRNNYLALEQRNIAPILYKNLQNVQKNILNGKRHYAELCQQAKQDLLQAGFKPDYFEICRRADLQTATENDKELIIIAAAYLGKTRLIDNLQVDI